MGEENFHVVGLDEETRLAVGTGRDGLEIAGRGQLAALVGKRGAAFRQTAPNLDGDEVREAGAVLRPIEPVRRNAQDRVGSIVVVSL